jgi:phosphoadenosine phosphosulfate reductase
MYNYTYDTQTGGLLLNTSPMQFSKEPRPVYYKELDLLGFDRYWAYEKQDALPYMGQKQTSITISGVWLLKQKAAIYMPPLNLKSKRN